MMKINENSGLTDIFRCGPGGLGSRELASAKLSRACHDLLVGPRNDGEFSSTQEVLSVSGLSDRQPEGLGESGN